MQAPLPVLLSERLVFEHFARQGWEVTRSFGRVPYDLLSIGRVEVKTDRRAAETGNAPVEELRRLQGTHRFVRPEGGSW